MTNGKIMRKVVVTGIGLTTPLGIGRERTWGNLLDGHSAVRRDQIFPDVLTSRINDLDVPAETRLLSLGFLAAAEAIHDATLASFFYPPERLGCTVSVSKPDISFKDLFYTSTLGKQLFRIFNFRGPMQNLAAACATGADSIILGADWIRQGVCDAVLAGSAETSLNELYVSGFRQMGVLSAKGVRPFDRNRDGFAIGEGAGIVMLERADTAIMRGAKIYGEVSGWDMSNDASGPVAFNSDGSSITGAIKRALKRAGLESVDYINAHGTATYLNDIVETRAICGAFGTAASKIPVSSTKAATGHLLGACGAVEAAFCLLSMRDAAIPPTLNLQEPDPECGLDYVPGVARHKVISRAMSLSFGFGGQIGVIIFSL
jgi:3-oxoacyl-(acyl-carrier-protein) synthase